MKVDVAPGLLRWAVERAGCSKTTLAGRFPKLSEWLRGEDRPTLKQLERFAQATHAPGGYFFLREPPHETVPIPDLRTIGNVLIVRPSSDLLDTIYLCLQRQKWYREYRAPRASLPLPSSARRGARTTSSRPRSTSGRPWGSASKSGASFPPGPTRSVASSSRRMRSERIPWSERQYGRMDV
jgi:transcriptional regulator with XRE-family HTH domain